MSQELNSVSNLHDLPAFLTVYELARLLRIGKSLAYDLVKRGEIRSIRIGRTVRIPRDCLVEWLDVKRK